MGRWQPEFTVEKKDKSLMEMLAPVGNDTDEEGEGQEEGNGAEDVSDDDDDD